MGNCVEISFSDSVVLMRDSKDKTKVLTLTQVEWSAFVTAIQEDEYTR